MRQVLLPLLACAALAAQPDAKPSADVKVGTGVEKLELQGAAADFKVPAGTKLYAWTRVTGVADSTVTVVFSMGDRATKQELAVPHSPYRTNAYRTFRAGDAGRWTVKVLGADGAELGSADFTVDIQ